MRKSTAEICGGYLTAYTLKEQNKGNADFKSIDYEGTWGKRLGFGLMREFRFGDNQESLVETKQRM